MADFVVRQLVTTPFTGAVDCVAAAERCLVAIGAVSDYDRSGGSFVGFAGAPPFPEPALVVEPPGPYEPGQTVSVRAAGLLWPRLAQLLQCRDERCVVLHRGQVAADGTFGADVAVQPLFPVGGGEDVACEGACVIRVDGIGVNGASSAPMPPPVPIEFTAPAASTSSMPHDFVSVPPPPSEPVVSVPATAVTLPTETAVAGSTPASTPPTNTSIGG